MAEDQDRCYGCQDKSEKSKHEIKLTISSLVSFNYHLFGRVNIYRAWILIQFEDDHLVLEGLLYFPVDICLWFFLKNINLDHSLCEPLFQITKHPE